MSEGLRLPNDFEPLSYDIGLVPELFPSTSTHKQRSEMLKSTQAYLAQVSRNLLDAAESACNPTEPHLPQRRVGDQPGKHLHHTDGQPTGPFFAAGNSS